MRSLRVAENATRWARRNQPRPVRQRHGQSPWPSCWRYTCPPRPSGSH